MNPSRYLIITSAITLTVGAIYATKPTKRVSPTRAYARAPFNCTIFSGSTSLCLTTVLTGTTKKARVSTAGGTFVTLRTSSLPLAKTIYFKF
ncbi:hypothetical protein SAMN05428988_1555 [Chitinophaga sp. YR573]|nr:hypothetical protein SAMN05428988_1555 [Chitinophaga sp. YR573]